MRIPDNCTLDNKILFCSVRSSIARKERIPQILVLAIVVVVL